MIRGDIVALVSTQHASFNADQAGSFFMFDHIGVCDE